MFSTEQTLEMLTGAAKDPDFVPHSVLKALPFEIDPILLTSPESTHYLFVSGKLKGTDQAVDFAASSQFPRNLALNFEPALVCRDGVTDRPDLYQIKTSKWAKGDAHALVRQVDGIKVTIIVDETGHGIALLWVSAS